MARKSRKNRNVESNIQTVVKKENLLDTAAYIRLSVENGGNETDETLVVQQMLVERFIEEHPDLRLEEVYIDNGFTGTNFERPGFMRLMEDVRSGKVQCIVVKDLSRFGRDYLETGYYLETILPKLNVRFIAITDDYDSSRKEDRENISVPIKNMVNAMYAKDMSKKILAAKEAQKRNGNITLSKVAFGYVRSEDKTRQVVDETVAPVVRMIFQWTLLGVSKREIADRLNLLGIATPGQKEKRKIARVPLEETKWNGGTVRKILENPTYTGDIVTGKLKQSLYKGVKQYRTVPEEWDVQKDMHTPLVAREDYLRLSIADGDLGKENKDESNSIDNQRSLLVNFITDREDMSDEYIEYVDDGYSGTNFERPAFKKMIEDAKAGKIDTVIVKDFSRFGRDYIGVGDYLEQVFPLLGIRFISLNNNYDSKEYIGKTMGLDMAINNLVNNLYSKDISKKLKSALKVKWKNGKWTGSKPPFGYLKDEEHGCWKIDPVAGKYVRMIFDKAMEGCNTSQICYYMNEQKVPTPGKYNQMNGLLRQGNYKMPDKEVVWDTGMIRTILGRFEYTGALVMGRRHTVAVGSKVTRKTAERDVVIRKNINPAIITEEEYEVASASIMFMTKPEYRGAKDFLLKGKVRCGNCHRSLAYTDGGIHPKIYCPHKVQAGRYSHCPEDAYPVSVIEGHIWYSLKRILRILDSVQRESEEKYTDNSFTGKKQQRVLESELEKLKNERIHQYEAYAEGVLSREKYITVKKQLTEKIEKIQSEQKALASVIIEEERYRSRIRTAVQQLEVQIERGKLTKEIIDTMIDTVYVYDKKRIEVILRFDDVLQKVISEYTEGAKGA